KRSAAWGVEDEGVHGKPSVPSFYPRRFVAASQSSFESPAVAAMPAKALENTSSLTAEAVDLAEDPIPMIPYGLPQTVRGV
ncbi:MAG: hypothetical protein ACK5OB_18275, partial [Pirellula sp.]